jgi:hypothetical protein
MHLNHMEMLLDVPDDPNKLGRREMCVTKPKTLLRTPHTLNLCVAGVHER